MHDTATSKKTGDFLQATRLRRKLPQLFDFYVKSHAWFGGGAILLRGPLRLKLERLAAQAVDDVGAILLRGPLRLKHGGTQMNSFSNAKGAILLRGPLRLKLCWFFRVPFGTEGAILLRGPLRLKPREKAKAEGYVARCNLTSRPSETETYGDGLRRFHRVDRCNLTSRPSETET